MSPGEAVFAVFCAVLLVRQVFADRAHAAERRRLLHALISRNAAEYSVVERRTGEAKAGPDDDRPLRPVPVGLE